MNGEPRIQTGLPWESFRSPMLENTVGTIPVEFIEQSISLPNSRYCKGVSTKSVPEIVKLMLGSELNELQFT